MGHQRGGWHQCLTEICWFESGASLLELILNILAHHRGFYSLQSNHVFEEPKYNYKQIVKREPCVNVKLGMPLNKQ